MSKEGQGLKERNYATGPGSEIQGEALTVKHDRVRPNAYNYNTQNPATFNKLVASMRQFGFTLPIIVREVGKGLYEIIDGEHRWRAAKSLAMPEVRIINLGKVSDEKAKQLTIILNELGGQPDQVRLADLLRDINNDVDFDALAAVMPYSNKELSALIESVDFSFANMSDEDTRPKAEAAAVSEDDPEADPETATPAGSPAVEVPEEELAYAEEEDVRAGGPPPKVSKITIAIPASEAKAFEVDLIKIHDDPYTAIKTAVQAYLNDQKQRAGVGTTSSDPKPPRVRVVKEQVKL